MPMYGLHLDSCCVHTMNQVDLQGYSGCVCKLLGFFVISWATTVVNGAEWLGGNSQQVTGDRGLI